MSMKSDLRPKCIMLTTDPDFCRVRFCQLMSKSDDPVSQRVKTETEDPEVNRYTEERDKKPPFLKGCLVSQWLCYVVFFSWFNGVWFFKSIGHCGLKLKPYCMHSGEMNQQDA